MGRKVMIAGGGASGLMAAIASAREGAEVTVLEGMERCGKKLLVTGNGRCNMTNLDEELPEKYYGTGAEMAEKVIRRFDAGKTISFFEELGLLTQEKNGYVYPYSAQAGAVLEVLLAELRRLKVKLKFGEKIESIEKKDGQWQVRTATWCYSAQSLVLACGSKAAPATGSDGNGYALAKMLGHTVILPRPALAPLVCSGNLFAPLAGVRCRSRVSLFCEKPRKMQSDAAFSKSGREGNRQPDAAVPQSGTGNVVSRKSNTGDREAVCLKSDTGDNSAVCLKSDIGELQWTKYGVSGIVIFQLSRFVSTHAGRDALYLEIDLLPDFGEQYLSDLIKRRRALTPNERGAVLLSGILHEKLIAAVMKYSGVPAKAACGAWTDQQVTDLLKAIKHLRIDVKETKSFDVCQVCAGGVDCREVSPEDMQSLKHDGLYFAGEILDVDGPCGGYNLQWAWSSGYTAGSAAAKNPV